MSAVSPPPTPPSFQEPEPFVPPEELEIPHGMEIVSSEDWQVSITLPVTCIILCFHILHRIHCFCVLTFC